MVSEEGAGTESMSTVTWDAREWWTPVKPSVLAPFPAPHGPYLQHPFLSPVHLTAMVRLKDQQPTRQ